jgi:hypothetical protein
MTTAADAPADPDDMLDLPALLRDVDLIRRHREMTWKDVSAETGIRGPKLSDLINGKIRAGLVTYQRLTRWIDPSARDYLLPGAAPARIPKETKLPPRFRQPGTEAAA